MKKYLVLPLIFVFSLTLLPTSFGAGEDYCTPEKKKSSWSVSGVSTVFPWGISANRSYHVTNPSRTGFAEERGFYDVPRSHPLYAELEKFYLWGVVTEKCPHILDLGASLSRGELAKSMTQLGLYHNFIPGVVVPLTDPYKDIPVDHVLALQVHTLKSYNIVSSTASHFFPERTATKIEAIAMLSRMYPLQGDQEVILPYTDIDPTAWYITDVKKVYSLGLLPPTTTLSPSAKLTKEEFFTLLSYFDKKYEKLLIFKEEADEEDSQKQWANADAPTSRSTKSLTTTETKTFSVEKGITLVQEETPKTLSVYRAAQQVPLLSFTLTNGETGNVSLKSLTVRQQGFGSKALFDRFTLTRGSNVLATGYLSSGTRSVSFSLKDELILAPGQSVTLMVKTHLTRQFETATFSFMLGAGRDIEVIRTKTGAPLDVQGRFPMSGTKVSLSERSNAGLTVTSGPASSFAISEHSTENFLQSIRFRTDTPEKKLRLTALTIRFRGSIEPKALRNLTLTASHSGEQVGNTVSYLTGDTATFLFTREEDGGLLISQNLPLTLELYADIKEAGKQTLRLRIDEASDVEVFEEVSRMGVPVDVDGFNDQAPKITIEREADPVWND